MGLKWDGLPGVQKADKFKKLNEWTPDQNDVFCGKCSFMWRGHRVDGAVPCPNTWNHKKDKPCKDCDWAESEFTNSDYPTGIRYYDNDFFPFTDCPDCPENQ